MTTSNVAHSGPVNSWPHQTRHQAELARLKAELFGGKFPPALVRVLAVGQAVADGYLGNHALEKARGWCSMDLLRSLHADEVRMVRRLAGAGTSACTHGSRSPGRAEHEAVKAKGA